MPRRPPETATIEFRLRCKGLTAKELGNIYKDLRRTDGCQPAFRNPAPPDYAAQAVHDIIVHISWPAATAYIGKRIIDKMADILASVVERRLTNKEERKKTVTIYDPNGAVHTLVELKPEKPRVRR
jgi:hypothetical protein